MTEHDRAEFDRLVQHILFVDRVVITLLKEFMEMSNLDDLKAKVSEAAAGIKSRDEQIAALKAQIAASAGDDAALPGLTAELDGALHPAPAAPPAPEAPVDPAQAEQPAA